MDIIKELEKELRRYNISYRQGTPEVPDFVYDEKLDTLKELDPANPFLSEIGYTIRDDDPRKVKLPIMMASMEKEKTIEGIRIWMKRKNIKDTEIFVLSAKLDGISFCLDEVKYKFAATRGNGIYGQLSNEHYKLISNKTEANLSKELDSKVLYSYGEVIMPKSIFNEKYSDFANPRNLVGGQLNAKDPSEILKDCNYIRYGLSTDKFEKKHHLFTFLNKHQEIKIPYLLYTLKEIVDNGGEDFLKEIYLKWSQEYQIDGIIIEINDIKLGNLLIVNLIKMIISIHLI